MYSQIGLDETEQKEAETLKPQERKQITDNTGVLDDPDVTAVEASEAAGSQACLDLTFIYMHTTFESEYDFGLIVVKTVQRLLNKTIIMCENM